MLRHTVVNQLLDILLPHVIEELLTGRTDEVVPSRFFDGETNDRLENIELHEVVEEITIVDPEANSEEPKCSQAEMLVSGGKEGGNPGGDIRGEEEEMAAERMLKCEITQKVAKVKEQICSFLRHGEGGFL